jgi:hypothetical protein
MGDEHMQKISSVFALGGLLIVSIAQSACGNAGDKAGVGSIENALVGAAAAAEPDKAKESSRSADSSPFVVGVWKFINTPDGHPTVDTEFRFINPTSETLTLEYAFFDADGGFCGCDRDDFPPNKTTEYSMFDELGLGSAQPGGPAVFSCTGAGGALKSIVFKHKGQHIFIDDAAQVGFQTHVFGNVLESDQSPLLIGNVMTEAPLQGIALTESTEREIRSIHEQCVKVNGLLPE